MSLDPAVRRPGAATSPPSSARRPSDQGAPEKPPALPSGLSIVVPVFNSEATLDELARRIHEVLTGLGRRHELILVDDGSGDGSWTRIEALVARHGCVRGIRMMRNYGHHNAVLCGIRRARFDVTVTLDDDLQNPPEEIPRLVATLDEGADVVYGRPSVRQHGLWRNLASAITRRVLARAMGAETAADVSAFRAFRTRLRDAFEAFRGPYVSIDVLLTWGSSRFVAIPVRHERRAWGRSTYTFGALVGHALNMVTGFTTLPLRLAAWVGFSLTGLGVLSLVWVVGRYFVERAAPPGFTFLASIVAIFSGAQLFCLGILGEYLARMHFRSMDRPPFLTRIETPVAAAEEEHCGAESW